MRADSISTQDLDSWTRRERCVRSADSRDGASSGMFACARVVIFGFVALPAIVWAQTGPSDPQIINAASTTKVNIGQRNLGGQLVATVRVGEDGKVSEVTVVENTTDGFESQLTKVLQNAR